MRALSRLSLSIGCVLLGIGCASAQDYPNKPVKVVVSSAPGSLNDTINRFVLTEVTRSLGQPVVVDNQAGGAGILGIRLVTRQTPDGYTLLGIQTTNTVASVFLKDPGFDMRKDLAPVISMVDSPILLTTYYGTPFNTLTEMAAYAKANPGKLNHGLPGLTDLYGLYMGAVKSKYGVRIVDVPYKTSVAYIQALAANEVQVAFSSVGNAMPLFKDKKTKPLAITGEKRHAAFPDLPTFAELGIPEIESLKFMIFVPANTPKPVIDKLNAAYAGALQLPETRNRFTALDLQIVASTPAALGAHVVQSLERYRAIAQSLGIQPE